VPRARATLSATFERGRVAATAQTRFIGAAKLVNAWTGRDVDRNRVPAIAYVDLRVSGKLTDKVRLYGTVDNLLDQDPPLVPGTSRQGQNVYYFTATRGDIYDTIGRAYRIGLAVRF
jgi:outer membrane receptor protein involved in Fe transport